MEERSPAKLIASDTWEKWTGVYDGNMIYLYRNDLLVASTPAEGSIGTTGNICLGHDCFDEPNKRYFDGLVDEVAIYSRALSNVEIKSSFINQSFILEKSKPAQVANQTSNLLFSYSFDNGVQDSSGKNTVLTLEGGATISNGGKVNALSLANGGFAKIDSPLSDLSAFTLVAWIKPSSVTKDSQAIAEKGDIENKGWQVYITKDKAYYFSGAAEQPIFSNSGIIQAGKWQNIVVTWDGDFVKIFVDGAQVGVGPATAPLNDAPTLLVGARYYGGSASNNFEGTIDEFRLYSQSMTKDEIQVMYDSEKASFTN